MLWCYWEVNYVCEEKPKGTPNLKAGDSLEQRVVTQGGGVWEHSGWCDTSCLFANHVVTLVSPLCHAFIELEDWNECCHCTEKWTTARVWSGQVHDISCWSLQDTLPSGPNSIVVCKGRLDGRTAWPTNFTPILQDHQCQPLITTRIVTIMKAYIMKATTIFQALCYVFYVYYSLNFPKCVWLYLFYRQESTKRL